MKKTVASPPLSDQIRGSLGDIREGSMHSLPADRPLPVALALNAAEVRAARPSASMRPKNYVVASADS